MKKIDTLWSVAVKSKAGYWCEQCGSAVVGRILIAASELGTNANQR